VTTYFEEVLTSGEIGASKPCPEAFQLACERLCVAPKTVLYVGDRLDIDARAASAAGLTGCVSTAAHATTTRTSRPLRRCESCRFFWGARCRSDPVDDPPADARSDP